MYTCSKSFEGFPCCHRQNMLIKRSSGKKNGKADKFGKGAKKPNPDTNGC